MNPPVTGPEITGADTQSKSSLTLDACFHGCVPRRSTHDAAWRRSPVGRLRNGHAFKPVGEMWFHPNRKMVSILFRRTLSWTPRNSGFFGSRLLLMRTLL